MIENFGSYLKHERELRGVPLEEISGTTKIHIRFLQALEENKFDELPGKVFIKGYIRSYANTIGSDVEETLNIYEESVGDKQPTSISDSESKPKISATNFLGLGLISLFLVALFFLIKFLILDKNISDPKIKTGSKATLITPSKKETMLKVEKDSLKEELAENIIPEESFSEKASGIIKEKVSLISVSKIQNEENSIDIKEGMTSKNLEKSLKLTIKVKNNTWFNITIDNSREEDFILATGEEKNYWGNKVFRLTIGNKEATDLILNGKALDLPESKEKIVKDFIIDSKKIESTAKKSETVF
tara:strand:+ start:1272 stop:2177 length:906 start_codon:yes stop_codon:yes gene_type:complete